MKNALIILSIVCVALIGGLWLQNKQAKQELKAALAETARFSNQCEQVNLKLNDQTSVNTTLMTNLTRRAEELAAASNQIARLKTSLAQADQAKQTAGVEIAERETRIKDWETSHGDLATKANEIKSSLGKLELEIAEVKGRLDASEGDRAFLLKELKRLQLEREQLDRQFHDLAAVRAQFEKLKSEKFANKRFAWADTTLIRPEYKGAEMLVADEEAPLTKGDPSLKVELQQDGSVRLVAPIDRVR